MIHLSLISPPHLVPTSCSLPLNRYLNWVSANLKQKLNPHRILSEKSSSPSSHTHTKPQPCSRKRSDNQKIPKLGFETERGFPQFRRGEGGLHNTHTKIPRHRIYRKRLCTQQQQSASEKNDDDILPTNEHIFQRADSNDLVLPNPNIRFTAVKQCNKIVLYSSLHQPRAGLESNYRSSLIVCVLI